MLGYSRKQAETALGQGICGATAIVVITLVVYIPAMRAGFIWDDDEFLTNNLLIKAHNGLYRFWFTTQPRDYFPLTLSMLWVEWRLWGMNAAGYHILNVLLHAISAVLVWRILKRLKIPGAWLAGMIFGIHPVNVESVAWITERKNTLPMAFYLATILLYLQFESRGRRLWFVLALISFLLALLSKTSVVMLPFVLLIIAWWQRGRIDRRDVFRAIPFFCLAVALGLVTWWFQYHRAIGPDIVRTDSLPARLAGAGWAVWFYLSKALVPYKLTFVYPRWQIDPSSVVSYLPGAALVGCLGLFWRYRGGWGRPLLAGLGYYVITLLPTLGFLNIYFMLYSLVADHWQYTSIIGVIALVVGVGGQAAARFGPRGQRAAFVLAAGIVAIFSALTFRQGYVYADLGTLWRDTLAKNPSAWLAHNNLGTVLIKERRLDEAIKHLHEALRLNPDYAEAHNNLGLALTNQRIFDGAIEHYSEALRLKPAFPEAHNNLGNVLLSRGKLDEAIGHYTEALRLNPAYPQAHINLAGVLATRGKLDEAIAHYTEGLRLNPAFPEAQNNLGIALVNQGKPDQAVMHLTKAIEMSPDYAEAYNNRGNAYAGIRDYRRALQDYDKAIELKPDFAEAYNNRALVQHFLKE